MKNILLDTNAYVRYLRSDESVLHLLSESKTVYMSIIVIGELLTGFKGGTKESWNKEALYKFLRKSSVQILDATIETSEIFAEIMNSLKKSGNPIPLNDVWIAAHTVETGSLLITFDTHFTKIPGLRIWDYKNNIPRE